MGGGVRRGATASARPPGWRCARHWRMARCPAAQALKYGRVRSNALCRSYYATAKFNRGRFAGDWSSHSLVHVRAPDDDFAPSCWTGVRGDGRGNHDRRCLITQAFVPCRPLSLTFPSSYRCNATRPTGTFAGVAELVDALDLGSSAARRGGSSPLTRTINGPGRNEIKATIRDTTRMQVTETLNEGLKRKLSVTIPAADLTRASMPSSTSSRARPTSRASVPARCRLPTSRRSMAARPCPK